MKASSMLREFRHHPSIVLILVLNLSLGLMGFLALDAFKDSLSEHLKGRSKAILGADMGISARRELKNEEKRKMADLLPEGSQIRREVSLFTMVRHGMSTRLVQVRAVDKHFPFYGAMELENSGPWDHENNPLLRSPSQGSLNHDPSKTQTSPQDRLNQSKPNKKIEGIKEEIKEEGITKSVSKRAWVYPELAHQLGLDVGDELQIGASSFKVMDFITADPSVSNMGFSPAPKVVISLEHLPETELLQFGSRLQESQMARLPQGSSLRELMLKLREALPQSDLRVSSHREASRQLSTLLRYMGDYLGLISLVALFLAAISTAYLFRTYIEKRKRTIATYRALGMTPQNIMWEHLLQLAALGALAALLALSLARVLLPWLPQLLGHLMMENMSLSMSWRSVALSLTMGVLGAILFGLPSLLRMGDLKPSALFSESNVSSSSRDPWWSWLPCVVVFWLLSLWQCQSWKTGNVFFFSFALAALLALGISKLWMWSLAKISVMDRHWTVLQARLAITRKGASSSTCFAAIGLGALLIHLVPQISSTLRGQLDGDPNRPSLFLFDIQPEQLEGLKQMLKERGQSLSNPSPLIAARLLKIDGKAVKIEKEADNLSREEERARRMRNRNLNLSIRPSLSKAETLIRGREFSGIYSGEGPIELSLEKRYAQRIGVDLNSHMSFDIMGMEVDGVVVNLRSVRWTSFQPNFFILVQPGLLEDAPQTFIASLPSMPLQESSRLQGEIVKAFHNISLVDITQVVNSLFAMVDQMALAVRWVAIISILAGLGVLFSIVQQQASLRLRDHALMRAVGAKPKDLMLMGVLEILWLSSAAVIFGWTMSLAMSKLMAQVFFDGAWEPAFWGGLFQSLLMISVCVITGFLASWRSLKVSPVLSLRA